MGKHKMVPQSTSTYIKVLHENGFKAKEIQRKVPSVSLRQVYRHVTKDIEIIDKRKKYPGKPRLLDSRDERQMLCSLNSLRNECAYFSVKRLQEEKYAHSFRMCIFLG